MLDLDLIAHALQDARFKLDLFPTIVHPDVRKFVTEHGPALVKEMVALRAENEELRRSLVEVEREGER